MANEKGFLERLANVQKDLKAPKGQYNSFGRYNYRSCEDILEAVKSLLHKNDLCMIVWDDLIHEDGQAYIRANVKVMLATDKEQCVTTTAYAMIDTTKKGMDAPQQTGTASSYARKYALNGMFLIDDTKDSDTDEHKTENEAKAKTKAAAKPKEEAKPDTSALASKEEIEQFKLYLETEGIEEQFILEMCKLQNLTMITSKAIAQCSNMRNLEDLKKRYNAWKEQRT